MRTIPLTAWVCYCEHGEGGKVSVKRRLVLKRLLKVLMVAVLMAVILWPASPPRWPREQEAECCCRRPSPALRTPKTRTWSSTHPDGPRDAGFVAARCRK